MISKIELKLISVIILLFFLFWEYIINLQFVGEGFQYFQVVSNLSYNFSLTHDIFARIIFIPLQYFFKERVYLYMLFMLIYVLIINMTLYFSVKSITKNIYTAFFTTLLFSLSHVANYNIFSSGGYQYFVQRGTPLPLLIISFAYMCKYFNDGLQLKYLVCSLVLYVLAIFLGFFAAWLMPLFIVYPIVFILFHNKKNIVSKFKISLIPIIFVTVTMRIIRDSSFSNQENSPLHFLINKPVFVFENIAHQFNILVLPVGSYKQTIVLFENFLSSQVNPEIALSSVFLFIYITLIVLLIIKLPEYRELVTALFISLFGTLAINTYLNASTVMSSFDSSRYFYYPYFYLSLIWGIVLSYLFKKSILLKTLSVVLIFMYLLNNYFLIYQNRVKDEHIHKANKSILNFFDQNKSLIQNNSLYIYLPSTLGPYGVEFVNKFYGSKHSEFVLENFEELDYQKLFEKELKPENLYVFHYDQQKQKVYDQTLKSRGMLRKVYEIH